MGRGLFPPGMQLPFAAGNQLSGGRSSGRRRRRRGKKAKATRRKGKKRGTKKGRKMKFGSPAWQKKYKVGKYRK